MKTEKYNVTGMTCAACQANVTRCVQKLDGVREVNVSLLANQMTVSYDEGKVNPQSIVQAVTEIGYGASPAESAAGKANDFPPVSGRHGGNAPEEGRKGMKHRLIASLILLVPLMYIAMGPMMGLPVPELLTGMENTLISALAQLVLTVPILVINQHFFVNGFRSLFHRAPNMDSLVASGPRGHVVRPVCHVPHGLWIRTRGYGGGARIRPRPLL